MAAELGLNSSRMDCGRAHAASFEPAVESHRVQNICGLRAAVRGKGLIGSPLEIRIFKVDIAYLVTSRGERDDSSAGSQQRHQPIDEDEVPQMIGPELRLET